MPPTMITLLAVLAAYLLGSISFAVVSSRLFGLADPRSYGSIYSSDGFHPNDAGYAYIASEVVRAATLASYPAPQSSCAAMTVVPNP